MNFKLSLVCSANAMRSVISYIERKPLKILKQKFCFGKWRNIVRHQYLLDILSIHAKIGQKAEAKDYKVKVLENTNKATKQLKTTKKFNLPSSLIHTCFTYKGAVKCAKYVPSNMGKAQIMAFFLFHRLVQTSSPSTTGICHTC